MRTLQALFNRITGIAHDEADRLYRAYLIFRQPALDPVVLERPACWRRARACAFAVRSRAAFGGVR